MVSKELQSSLEDVFDSQPERSDMIIKNMDKMPSVGHGENQEGTARNFLHLNQISEYVDRFLGRKGADPAGFAPPSKPKSSNLSQKDTDMFVGKTIGHSVNNWDKTQQKELLATGFKAGVSTKVSQKEAELKGQAIKQERATSADNKSFLNKTQDNIQNVRDALTSREAIKGGVKGFLTGGQAGVVKGYTTGAVASLAKNKRDHDFVSKSDKSAEKTQDSAAIAGPKRKP